MIALSVKHDFCHEFSFLSLKKDLIIRKLIFFSTDMQIHVSPINIGHIFSRKRWSLWQNSAISRWAETSLS
jgi:hypothetical protein